MIHSTEICMVCNQGCGVGVGVTKSRSRGVLAGVGVEIMKNERLELFFL